MPRIPDVAAPLDPAAVTPGDIQAQLERFRQTIDRSNLPLLLEHVRRLEALCEHMGMRQGRVPVPFVADGAPSVEVTEQLCVSARLSHLVVSSETAAAYDLQRIEIGMTDLKISPSALPLEPFDVRAASTSTFPDAMHWKNAPTIEPFMTVRLCAVRRKDWHVRRVLPRFVALLWMDWAI